MEETYGERILRFRRRLGLSQAQLAEMLDVKRSTVVGWEYDKHLPTPRHRTDLATVLGATESYLDYGDAGEAARFRHQALSALKALTEARDGLPNDRRAG